MNHSSTDVRDVEAAQKRFASTDHLDDHFQSNRIGYRDLLHRAGIEPGWHVLDAGAGGGNYLPLIADLVGETGKITALDLSAENVEIIRQRREEWDIPCPVEAVEGNVVSIPFDDDTFDAVWCANTSQFLSDEELDQSLREFRRVTRPDGLVAIKDTEGAGNAIRTMHPEYIWRMHDRFKSWEHFRGAWRSWNLQRFLERAGLVAVWSQNTLIEHRAPLTEVERRSLSNFWSKVVAVRAVELTREAGVDGDELQFWVDLRDDTPDSVLNSPDFYSTEGQILAVGRVP
ncbi:MAG: methyltransferase domain-containing protein [Thermomicrobiales bacterium]